MFSQIKDRKHIEQNFYSVAKVMPLDGTGGAGGVKNFSGGICDGAPSTARSSFVVFVSVLLPLCCHIGSDMPYLCIFVEEVVTLLGAIIDKLV